MKEFLAHCEVIDGKLQWKNEAYLHVNLPKFEGMKGTLTIKKKWNKRSLSQNKLYWLWVTIISKDLGYTENELHTLLKGKFGPKKAIVVGGKTYNIPKSTTDFTKGEFVEFMFFVEKQAAELNILLPHPEDLDMIEVIK